MSQAGFHQELKDRVEEPELWVDLQLAYLAYQVLHSHRTQGFNGPQPISLLEVETYCRVYSYPGSVEDLAYFVRKMDAVLVEVLEEERKRQEQVERSKMR